MQTTRMSYRSGAPTTDFYQGADIVAQSQAGNYSVVRVSATAINRGFSGSYDNSYGAHTAAIDGYGQVQKTGSMPSGYGTGATRWDLTTDIGIAHNAAGYMGGVTLRQTVAGWFENVQTAALYGFARIPKRPAQVSTPWFSEIMPTSVKVHFTFDGDQGGINIDGYLVRYWPNAEGTGQYIDVSQDMSQPRVVTGLTPGKEYRFVVYAHTGAQDNNGYSNISGAAVVRTLSGMWVRYQSVWRRAVPYVKIAGVWRATSVFIKDFGTWKRGG